MARSTPRSLTGSTKPRAYERKRSRSMRRWVLVIGATMLLLVLAAVVLTPVFLYAAVMHAARQ
ncbi:MAG TPA: hypothetical protein VFU72_10990, partial [Nitrolancea sp.]|nr:hypothetical protein [Nitrolancea sp.]